MNADLAEMFRYNAWANQQLFQACRALSDEQLDARPPGISGTVRELLVHIAGGQQTFTLRVQGRQHEYELTRQSAWPGWEALLQIVESTNQELIAIAEALEPGAAIDLGFQGKTYRFPQRFFLVHAMEHSCEHRAEVKIALGQAGIATPDLDCWFYAYFNGIGQEVAA